MNLKVILVFVALILSIIGAVLAFFTEAPEATTLWGLLFTALACYFGSLLVPADIRTP